MRLPEAIGRDLRARRHTALLIAIVAMFAVRPFFGDTGAGAIVFSLAILLVLLVALLTIQVDDLVGEREALLVQRRRRSFVGWALAVPAVAERLWLFFAPSPRLVLVGSFSWLLFFVYVTWSQLRSLLKQREVTGETISMSISIYLLLGLSWGLLYIVIFTRHPEAFSFGDSAPGGQRAAHVPHLPLFQPDDPIDHRLRRHHAADLAGALRGGRGGDHRAVLSGDSRRAPGGDADEPSRNSVDERSGGRSADREPGPMIDGAAQSL